MEFRLLGELQVCAAGRLLDVGLPGQQAVLAALLVDVGRPIPAETLVDRLWGERRPAQPRNVLYSHLSRIRRMLAEGAAAAGEPPARVVHRPAGYLLTADPEAVDLHRFRRLVERASDPGCSVADRAAMLRTALGLWGGTPLAGIQGEWAAGVRDSCRRRRLEAYIRWAEAELRLGDPGPVLTTLPDLIGEYPLVEPLEGLLMQALHAAGREAEALARYAAVRRRLVEELGVEPGADLRELHQKILRGEPYTARSTPPSRQPPADADAVAANRRDATRRSRAIWNIPPRNPHFTGRAGMLAVLHQRLQDGDGLVVVEALYGLGGVGKTQLAIEYAHQHAADYDIAWWIPAEQPALISEHIAALAPLLDLSVPAGWSSSETAAAVLADLGRRDRWLLIFDNAERPADLARWWPRTRGGRLLVTSRNPGWGGVGGRLEVDVLARAETIALLRARIRDLDQATAHALADELGDLPLAAEQAAAYLDHTGMPATDYLRLYRRQQGAYLARGHAMDHTGAEITAATLWSLSIDRLDQRNPAAVQLLRLCAFLAPEPIPLDLLAVAADINDIDMPLRAVAADEAELADTIGELVGYSLVRRLPDGIQIHRLVQAAVRSHLDNADRRRWVVAAVALLRRAAPGKTAAAANNWPRWQQLLPHALSVTAHPAADNCPDALAWLLDRAGSYLRVRGEAASARAYLERALAITKREHGAEHPAVAARLNNLALATGSPGKLGSTDNLITAQRLLERALRIAERTYPDGDRRLGVHLSNLGQARCAGGEFAAGTSLLARALAEAERTEHPDNATVAVRLNNLGTALCALRQPAAAHPVLERAVALAEKAHGQDHARITAFLNNLGAALATLGRASTAQHLLVRALARAEQAWGTEHRSLCPCLNNLGWALCVEGHPATAIPHLERAVTIAKHVCQPGDAIVGGSLNHLGVARCGLGQPAVARPLLEQAVAVIEPTWGTDHPVVFPALNNLGVTLLELDQPADARPLLERALTIGEGAYGIDHPDVTTCLNNLAAALAVLRRHPTDPHILGRSPSQPSEPVRPLSRMLAETAVTLLGETLEDD